jgi:hypothetical protein
MLNEHQKYCVDKAISLMRASYEARVNGWDFADDLLAMASAFLLVCKDSDERVLIPVSDSCYFDLVAKRE